MVDSCGNSARVADAALAISTVRQLSNFVSLTDCDIEGEPPQAAGVSARCPVSQLCGTIHEPRVVCTRARQPR